MKNLFIIVGAAALICLTRCAGTITPNNPASTVPGIDSSTPPQYAQQNSGFLGYYDSQGWVLNKRKTVGRVFGVLTDHGKAHYNRLIADYALRFRAEHKEQLVADAGVTTWKDVYGNALWAIDQEHIVDFGELVIYQNKQLPADSLVDKAAAAINGKGSF